jgi:serine/threonine protein kinase/Tol biopolymer transport system component
LKASALATICPKCRFENLDDTNFCGKCGIPIFGAPGKTPEAAARSISGLGGELATGALIAAKYRILAELGAGGMGEVYRAEDISLSRQVAIKVLPDVFAGDPERLARFEREARVLASLNHPNIAAIYGIEEADGKRFLILELVEGETLAERLGRGVLPLEETLDIFRQIAEGLEGAHEKGIIHRDLKPSNVKVNPEGKVKILDFGLARAFHDQVSEVDLAKSPTITADMTQPGIILGTAPYMSPEQAKGKVVDKRTDVWAFGCMLYECLTGKRPFQGETITEIVASILKSDPDWSAIPSETPTAMQSLLRRCLKKDHHLRLRDLGDARLEIVDALEHPVSPGFPLSPPRPSRWSRLTPVLIGAVAILAMTLIVFWYIFDHRQSPGSRAVVSVVPPPGTHLQWALVSPDGEKLILTAADPEGPTYLWLRAFDSPTARKLSGTAGATFPFWSPDSRSLGFFADGRLKRIDAEGGAVETLCEADNRGGTWGRDGTVVFTQTDGLFAIPATGGTPVRLTTLDRTRGENSHRWPSFLPDGRHVLCFVRNPVNPSLAGIYVVSLDTKQSRQLVRANSLAVYSQPGFLIYRRGESLVAHPFDDKTLRLTGGPVTIADGLWYEPSFTALANFSVSDTGRLVYRSGGIAKTELLWFDRRGAVLGRVGEPANYLNLNLSPDDQQVAVSQTDESTENRDIFIFEMTSNRLRQLSFDASTDFSPVWSPDGRHIVFSSDRQGEFDLYEMAASGSSEPRLLLKSSTAKFARDWSADGSMVIFERLDALICDIWSLRLQGLEATPLRQTRATEKFGVISPDSRWLAYCSNELGQFEIFVERLKPGGGRWKISSAGGFQPVWHPKEKELFYLDPYGKLMAVDILRSLETFEVSPPHVLFPTRVNIATVNPPDSLNHYDVSADGERFLIASRPEAASVPVVVVFNWNARLK